MTKSKRPTWQPSREMFRNYVSPSGAPDTGSAADIATTIATTPIVNGADVTGNAPRPDLVAMIARAIASTPCEQAAHVGEPRGLAVAADPSASMLAIDKDGMAICDRVEDAAFFAHARGDLLAAAEYIHALENHIAMLKAQTQSQPQAQAQAHANADAPVAQPVESPVTQPIDPPIERIIVARTDHKNGTVPADWVWMVRDARGLVVGFGTDSDYMGGPRALAHAIASYELRFDGPVPEIRIAQPKGDEVLGDKRFRAK